MHNCLNKRRSNTYEISETYEQTDLPEKLQKRNTSKHQELAHGTYEGRRKALKALAKQLVIETGCKPTHAHEIIAKSLGYKTYNAFLADKK